jgi:hypothetical protein
MAKRRTDPLTYLLQLMNDETATPYRRDRAAAAALPYCHPKMAEQGVKARRQAEAKKAGTGSEWGDDLKYVDVDERPPQ